MGGIEACRIRKRAPLLPILMLSVRDKEQDKIEALDAGADDYLIKPFSVPELAARLRAAVRRSNTEPSGPDEWQNTGAPIINSDIELDPGRRTVSKCGASVADLKEFELCTIS